MGYTTKTTKALTDAFGIDDSDVVPIDDDDDRADHQLVEYDDQHIVPLKEQQWEQEDEQIKDAVNRDYTEVRDNLRMLLDRGNDILDLAIQVAQGTENPKSIEAVTKVIGQLADVNTRLIDVTAKKQDMFIKARPKVNSKFAQALNGDPVAMQSITNNTMFVGSVSDLINQLNNIKNTNQNEDVIEGDVKQNGN